MRIALVKRPIDVAALIAEVTSASTGATTLFLGTVRDVNDGRDVSGIDYESYEPMAQEELARIIEEAQSRWPEIRVAVEHRLGSLALGDASVAIAVAHARRAPALEAQRYIIEQLKQRVPIWKREHYVDGTREWVDPVRGAAKATR